MPFMLYDMAVGKDDAEYSYVRTIQLAGTSGPLKKHYTSFSSNAALRQQWHASEADLLRLVRGSGRASAILIDLKPRQKGNISLYRLRNVWGFSYEWWTPLALHLETIFVDRAESDSSAFKLRFRDQGASREQVVEFLYLQGGHRGGTWNWGMVGRVNGALLWRDAYHYLNAQLTQALGL